MIPHTFADAQTIAGLDVYFAHARRDLEADQLRRWTELHEQFRKEKRDLDREYHAHADRIVFPHKEIAA